MLPQFEDYTEPLTESELKLVPLFVKGFEKHRGKENAITNRQIREKLLETRGIKLNEVTVRNIINHIRRFNLVRVLVASSNGYWVSDDKEELRQYSNSLRGRGGEILHIADCVDRYLNSL